MIRRVRVEYMRRNGTPGLMTAATDLYGNVYINKKTLPATKRQKTAKRETRRPTKP